MNKIKRARKMQSNVERKLRVSKFHTVAWTEHKLAVEKRVKKIQAIRHFHAEQKRIKEVS